MSLEKVNCPICDNQMTHLKNVKQEVEFDTIQPPDHVKVSGFMLVCKKCHNVQTFLEYGPEVERLI